MQFPTAIIAYAALFTAAAANPEVLSTRNALSKRFPCEENCRGTFDAGPNFGGNCPDVDTCIDNCKKCDDNDQKFTYGTCGCIKKGECDTKCYSTCDDLCGNAGGGNTQLAACIASCGKQCGC